MGVAIEARRVATGGAVNQCRPGLLSAAELRRPKFSGGGRNKPIRSQNNGAPPQRCQVGEVPCRFICKRHADLAQCLSYVSPSVINYILKTVIKELKPFIGTKFCSNLDSLIFFFV